MSLVFHGDRCGLFCGGVYVLDLFVYGTLMVPRLVRAVCGYSATGEAAILHGYCCRRLHGEVYPGIFPCEGETVAGLLYRDVGPGALLRLDAFEGDVYRRRPVTVSVEGQFHPAEAYVVRPGSRGLLSNDPWRLDEFLDRGLQDFLEGYPGFVAVDDGVAP
jgi:gamma-glutamylcyclotransferase (GGCT)/AIG2-like uncharacterized protein YtfP